LLYGHPLIIFITLPFGCPSRICLIKTLLEKNPMEKKFEWRKKSTTSFCVIICLVKNLTRKTQRDKTMVKGKRVQNTFMSPPHKDNRIWDKESQIIFYACFSKALLGGGDSQERSDLSPYHSPNEQCLRCYFHIELLKENSPIPWSCCFS